MTSQTRPRRLSCGVVVVRRSGSGPLLLMLRSFAHWDFPKGMQEADESPLETAIREVREETTIDDLDFPWGNESIDTGPYSNGKIARYFVGKSLIREIGLPVSAATGRPEHVEWRWVDMATARGLASPRLQRVLDWVEKRCPEFVAGG